MQTNPYDMADDDEVDPKRAKQVAKLHAQVVSGIKKRHEESAGDFKRRTLTVAELQDALAAKSLHFRFIDPDECREKLHEALAQDDVKPFVDWAINALLPQVATRFRRQVVVGTIRRVLTLGDGKAERGAIINRRLMARNSTADLPRATGTVTKFLKEIQPGEAQQAVNEVLRAVVDFFLARFPNMRILVAFDEIDLECHAKATEKRPYNDVPDHVRGSKEGKPALRHYVAAIVVPAWSIKIPFWQEVHSYCNLATGDEQDLPGIEEVVSRFLRVVESLHRLPSRILVDRGFESRAIQARFVAFSRKHGTAYLVTPVRAVHNKYEEVHLRPDVAELAPKAARKALLQGALSPYAIRELSSTLAAIKVDESTFLGIFVAGEPFAPKMIPGLTLILTRYKTDDKKDVESFASGKGWRAHMTYTTEPIESASQAAHLAREYRKRNFIESAFQQFHREFMQTGTQDMGARILIFGLSLLLLGLWALRRVWRYLWVTPGQDRLSLFEFLEDLRDRYTQPDEPPT